MWYLIVSIPDLCNLTYIALSRRFFAQGGTLIFSHICSLGYFLGFKILNFNILGGFQKNEYFWGHEDFVDIFLESSQNLASLRVISMHFRVFF